jgi:polar amino acid transport system ATP-binding protein
MIRIENLTKRHGERTILDGVSVSFERGKVTSVVGPSGGGKSTLLRCINGLEVFDEGVIDVEGAKLGPGRHDAGTLKQIRSRVGFVFQQFHLFPHRTAIGNVMEAPIFVRSVDPEVAFAEAKALLAKVGLGHRADAYPAELSGGEQQRVAIARALAMKPHALLLDEPTSALDAERKQDVLDLLQALAGEGTTMILVTHELAFAEKISQRIVTLRHGVVRTTEMSRTENGE